MGRHDDPALRRLPKYFCQAHDGNGARLNDVGEDLSRADRGQLVNIADNQQCGFIGQGLEQRLHQHHVDHGGFVDDEQFTVDRVVVVLLEPAIFWIDFEEAVNRLCLEARRLRHALCGAASGRAKKKLDALRRQNAQDGVDDRCLSDARTAGDDEDLRHQSQANGFILAFRQRQTGFLFDPGEGLGWIDPRPGQLAVQESLQPFGNRLFGAVEAGQKNAIGLGYLVSHDDAFAKLQVQGRLNQLLGDFEQFSRERQQLVDWQPAVAFIHGFGEGVGNSRAHADHRRLLDAEFHGDGVRRLEADPANISGEAIGVLRHHLHGVGAIGLEDPDSPRGADAVTVKEHHDLPHDFLFGPGRNDALGPDRANAVDLFQPIGLGFNDVEDLVAECLDHALGVGRPDSPDHPGGEIFLNSLGGRWGRCFQEPGLELLAMVSVVDPLASDRDPFPSGNRRGVADDGDKVAMTARLHAQDAEAILLIVERHALDDSGENLSGSIWRGALWGGHGMGVLVDEAGRLASIRNRLQLRQPRLFDRSIRRAMTGGRAMPVAQYFARDLRPICQVDAPW